MPDWFNQQKFDELPKYEELKYQYSYDFLKHTWDVFQEGNYEASINVDPDAISDSIPMSCVFQQSTGIITRDMDILSDFQKFQKRPEYKLLHIDIPQNIADFPLVYGELFAGAVFTRAKNHNPGCNPDEAFPQVLKYLNWLNSTDFFYAPASSKYHDSFAGGLCYHSLKVAQKIVDLMHTKSFGDNTRLGDAVFCALTHDLCKINLYEAYNKNVKNEATGAWEKVLAYRYTGNPVVNLGHGVSSMFMINKFFRLNTEEATAIRWHMGAYRVSDEEFNELQSSNEQFLLVHLLQFADQLSLVKY